MERIPLGASELGTLAHMLRNVKFFSPLTIGQLDNVLPHVMLCSYAAGEKVFRQGEPGKAFHIVYKGSVQVRLRRMMILMAAEMKSIAAQRKFVSEHAG